MTVKELLELIDKKLQDEEIEENSEVFVITADDSFDTFIVDSHQVNDVYYLYLIT